MQLSMHVHTDVSSSWGKGNTTCMYIVKYAYTYSCLLLLQEEITCIYIYTQKHTTILKGCLNEHSKVSYLCTRWYLLLRKKHNQEIKIQSTCTQSFLTSTGKNICVVANRNFQTFSSSVYLFTELNFDTGFLSKLGRSSLSVTFKKLHPLVTTINTYS